ncbi:hypothetical protein [Gulosibacter molinativorax]|uniref:DUF4190 domain-containing protein n=1 Tax=Gulosibacter molinativorax TaxID=256821 RepID=A0ABT7C6I6_9MICO|nr:hypothetical protein [Gulosibacter molinativorax]MDJ1370821.1 hypothetical protein [Gulosibacter molinativorax]QUY62158.1 Hypotetical protein [Gulosibacter molinativorax]
MPKLRRVPNSVFLVMAITAVLVALSIGAALWIEASENQRVADGGAADLQTGIGYSIFAGFIPVMVMIAACIYSGIALTKRTRQRQDAGLTPAGWGTRAGTSLGTLIVLLAGVLLVVWLLWFGLHVLLLQVYDDQVIDGARMAGSFTTVLGLVFGPGLTGGLPAILMTASAPTPEEENA